MKKQCALVIGIFATFSIFAETSVGVSIGINQPGVYGQIDIGNFPPPRVINQQPIVIIQSPVREPVYLYVPPGHQKHWEKHCHEYNACGRPVYFVREDWVRERYEEHRHDEGRDGDHGRDHGDHKKRKHEDD
ncbi:hypothetical protein [Rhodoferax sp. GW822-FHT02A01]|uniref:hypothetical protein n=1 Tax=Rhodoferax sp. GW822-FHT02A01 TaxID=3141537 RepID=UPI00315DB4DB